MQNAHMEWLTFRTPYARPATDWNHGASNRMVAYMDSWPKEPSVLQVVDGRVSRFKEASKFEPQRRGPYVISL